MMKILVIVQQNGNTIKVLGPLISIDIVKKVLNWARRKLITLGEAEEILIEEEGLLCNTC